MKKAFTKDSKERQFFSELWELCQRYWIPEDSDEFWQSFIDEIDQINEKYKDIHPAVKYMIAGFVNGVKEDANMGKGHEDWSKMDP